MMSIEAQVLNWNLLMDLCDAMKNRNKNLTKELLLENTIVVDTRCELLHTPVHLAILNFPDTELLQILINQEANIRAKNYYGQTPLKCAMQQQNIEAVELLLHNKAYLGENFKVLLETAINQESEKLVRLLIDCGVKNKLFKNLNDGLCAALRKKSSKFIKMVIPYCNFGNAEICIKKYIVKIGGHNFYECLNILLLHGFKLETGCEEDTSIVFDSVENGYLVVLKGLLSLGLDVDMRNNITGLTLLHTACIYKQYNVVELLLKHHADINCASSEGVLTWHTNYWAEETKLLSTKTPLFIAVKYADVKLLEILLNNRANMLDDPEFISLTSLVVQHNHLEILQILINHGFNVNAKTTDGGTLLHECANSEIPSMYLYTSQFSQFNGDIKHQIAQLLMKNGANIDAYGPDRETPLFIAIKNSYLKMIDFLLKHNANIHHKNIDGNTPLHVVAKISWISPIIVTHLLEYKANINEPNNNGITPFHFACKNWNSSLIQILIDRGADINLTDKNGQKAIHFAAEVFDNQVTRLLLQNGACVTDEDYYDRTPLHILCNYSVVTNEDIELFLQNGADINAIDIYHRTPLFNACISGCLETVKILLTHQANINHVDILGEPPVYVAAVCFPEIAKFLMDQETTNTDFVTRDGKTLLHALVKGNQIGLIHEYINILNIHINTADNLGQTPLFYAAAERQEKIVIMLLQHGADINIANNNQATVPMYIHSRMIEVHQDIANFLNSLCRSFNEVENGLRLREEYIPYWKKLEYYARIMQILRNDIIKLKAARRRLHPQNVRFSIHDYTNTDIYVDDVYNANLKRFEFLCEIEVELLKREKIPETEFCLYDILIKDIHTLADHISLEKIESFLQIDRVRKTFSVYIELINYRLKLAVRRNKLLDIARGYTESSIFFGLPEIVTNQIFSYLNNNEIKNLNQAVKVVKYLDQAEREEIKVLSKTDSVQFLRELKHVEIDSDEEIIQPTKKFKRY